MYWTLICYTSIFHRTDVLSLNSFPYVTISFVVFLSCNSCEMSIFLMRLNFRSNRSSKVTLQSQENNIRRTNNNTSGLNLYLLQRGNCLDICTFKIIFTALTSIRDAHFPCPKFRPLHFNKTMTNVSVGTVNLHLFQSATSAENRNNNLPWKWVSTRFWTQ